MLVLTPTSPYPSGVTAISGPADCGNTNPNDIAIVFTESSAPENFQVWANSAGGRLGGTFGLTTHEVGWNGGTPTDLMYWATDTHDLSYVDECLSFTGSNVGTDGQCETEHAEFCPAKEQNSYQELLATLGPAK
jgi:hypothetical protein